MRRLAWMIGAIVFAGGAAAHAASGDEEKDRSLKELRAAIVKRIATRPCGETPKQRAEFKLFLQDNGYVAALQLVRTSGAPGFDAALMSAIVGAQPYRLPADAAARKDLQNLNLKFDADTTPLPPCK
jgi:hypothetical protein